MYASQIYQNLEAPPHSMMSILKTGTKELDEEGESIIRNILVAYETDESQVQRYAKALFDTGCPDNLISCRVAAMLGFSCAVEDARDINLVAVTGERFLSQGILRGRWAFWDDTFATNNVHYGNTLKYMNAIFHVSSHENDQFDVIIGFNTIKEQRLLKLGEKLLAGFRRVQKTVDETVANADQIEANAKRRANAKVKDIYRQKKEKDELKQNSVSML